MSRPAPLRALAAACAAVCAVVIVASLAAAAPSGAAVDGPSLAALVTPFPSPPSPGQCVENWGVPCFSPQVIESVYGMTPLYTRGLTGKGRTIVIVDSFGSPTIASDLAHFDAGFGLPPPPSFSVIAPAGRPPAYNPLAPDMIGWATETSLDVEWAHAMAPGANILLVETPVDETIGVQGFPQMMQAENYVVDHDLGDVISQSFGAAEETFPSRRSLLGLRFAFDNAERHQVTVIAGTGDQGVSSPSNAAGTQYFTRRVLNWPADDPLVTAVGGTELHLDGSGGRYQADTVWNDTARVDDPSATNGGVSTIFGRPRYQDGVRRVVGRFRGTPDISLNAAAESSILVYLSFPGIHGPGFYPAGGTSESAPLFAGIVAVADQAAGRRLGLLNPALYALAAGRRPSIVPVTSGDNTVWFNQGGAHVTVNGYVAGRGYSLAAGLGTVDGGALVEELAHLKTG